MSNMKSSFKFVLIILAIIAAVVLFGVIGVQSARNKAIRLEEQIDMAKSEIDVQQKRRADLIPNLVYCVKAYDRHEYELILAVVRERGYEAGEVKTMVAAVAEAYPELKSSENYRELMNELSTTENLIANYRSNYNKWIREYKQHIRKFPNTMLLNLAGYEAVEYSYLEYDAPEDAPTGLFD